MRIITTALASAALLMSTAALNAQDQSTLKCYLSFGQNIAHNHSASMTGTPYGGPGSFQAEFGVEFLHPQSTLLVRPNAGYTRILSKEPKIFETDTAIIMQDLYDVLGVYAGFDLVYNISKVLPLTFTIGPSFHWWSVEKQGVIPARRSQGTRDVRLGVRGGVGYKFNEVWRVDLAYTMTEWRSVAGARNNTTGNPPGRVEGLNPSQPSYFTLKGTYTF